MSASQIPEKKQKNKLSLYSLILSSNISGGLKLNSMVRHFYEVIKAKFLNSDRFEFANNRS